MITILNKLGWHFILNAGLTLTLTYRAHAFRALEKTRYGVAFGAFDLVALPMLFGLTPYGTVGARVNAEARPSAPLSSRAVVR